ncbi:MAG TPA: acylphosphatase [Flavitalea sp.]|nr:acylphosphatase [Flavitalea sp.]
MLQTISIIVRGRVQGVFYRQSTKEKAIELNINGLVKNLPDGSVYILATGTTEKLNALVEWCWHGPRKAIVTDVLQDICALQHFDSFRIEK